jgi:hypothetical protein
MHAIPTASEKVDIDNRTEKRAKSTLFSHKES